MKGWKGSYLLDENGKLSVYHHDSDQYLPALDLTETREYSIAPAFRRSVAYPPLRAGRHRIDRAAFDSGSGENEGNFTAFGYFYNDGTLQVKRETAMLHYILAPQCFFRGQPTLTDNDWYYLTATNRAALGVEAFIGYWTAKPSQGQPDAKFWIKDWSIRDKKASWVYEASFEKLAPYREDLKFQDHGLAVPSYLVVNGTRLIAPNRWRNEVFLYVPKESVFHKVYFRDYDATVDEQYDPKGHYGRWATILESGTDHQTNPSFPTGFYNAVLAQDGQRYPLGPANSYIWQDDERVRKLYIDEHHTWLVEI